MSAPRSVGIQNRATASATTPACTVTGTPAEVLSRFDFNGDSVKPFHEPMLVRVAVAILRSRSRRRPIRSVCVIGHTDPVGSDDYNRQLGQRRADQVAQRLRAILDRMRPGLAATVTISTDTRGETQSVSSDPALNRRVEIFLPPPPRPPPRPRPPTPVPPDLQELIRKVQKILGSLPLGSTGIKLPTGARFLTPAEQAEARIMFGGSLDFGKILISDGLGFQGRPFTVAAELAAGWHVVMNLGSLGSWATRPKSSTLIHELAHAWQSQHHGSSPRQFMLNSVECQARAIAASVLSRQDASAYAYIPGKAFGEYAAEQIAQQVEDAYARSGRPTPSIVRTIRSVGPHARSLDNERSLTVISFHRRSEPGVVFH